MGNVHFSSDDGATTLCGYRPASRWAADNDRWTNDATQVLCAKCSAALRQRQEAS